MHMFFFEVIDRVIEQLLLALHYQACGVTLYNEDVVNVFSGALY